MRRPAFRALHFVNGNEKVFAEVQHQRPAASRDAQYISVAEPRPESARSTMPKAQRDLSRVRPMRRRRNHDFAGQREHELSTASSARWRIAARLQRRANTNRSGPG